MADGEARLSELGTEAFWHRYFPKLSVCQPLMPPFSSPTFQSRLMLVARQVLRYRHMYREPPEIEAYALSFLNRKT